MLYHFAKVLCNFCIRLYYGKIEINGLQSLPQDMPLLLACNHPTGFLEPVIIACIMDRPLHFITRGDLFSGRLLGPLMRGTHQIPIFRFKDGYGGLRQNKGSIAAAESALRGGGALIIFVEGKTEDVKMLKPLQKGMARISQSLHEEGLEHRIIPVGVNFLDSVSFRSRILLNFGPAVDPHPLFEQEKDSRKVLHTLNDVVSRQMVHQMFHVADRAKHPLHDQVLNLSQVLIPDLRSGAVVQQDTPSFEVLKGISDRIQRATDLTLWQQLVDQLSIAGKALPLLGRSTTGWGRLVQLILGLPLFIVGLLVNIWPVLAGVAVEKRLVESREFVAPIRFSASMGIGLVFYSVATTWLVAVYGLVGLTFLIGLPLAKVVVWWIDIYRKGRKKYTLTDAEIQVVHGFSQ